MTGKGMDRALRIRRAALADAEETTALVNLAFRVERFFVEGDRIDVEKVRGLMGSMATAQRSALEMAYWEGMSHSEIANKTGEPLGTVKTRIRAGLIALRKAFQT